MLRCCGFFFFFQAEDGIRDDLVTGVQTCALPIWRAVEMGDLRENSEYKAALERQQLVRARLSQLRERLSKLSSIDVTQIPNDKVGLGSTVLVRDEKSGLKETYHLVFGAAVDFEEGHVTMS